MCNVNSLIKERFNSRTPGGVRQERMRLMALSLRFQFTHPGRGATPLVVFVLCLRLSFNSRTPGGVRPDEFSDEERKRLFQFTHPGRGATVSFLKATGSMACFNSRTPGGVRRLSTARIAATQAVSIHAPREGCDLCV